jgi:hypothetical protein
MITLGIIVAAIGAIGLFFSGIQEYRLKEPKYLLIGKITAGILGIGGVIIGVGALL